MTTRVEAARRAMKEAEDAFREAARAHHEGRHAGTRDVAARYHERLESLVAAYDAVTLTDPRRSRGL